MLGENRPRVIGYWAYVDHAIKNIMPWDMNSASYTTPIANSAKCCQKKIINAIRELETKAKVNHYYGGSICRICHLGNGGDEYTYENYTWPSGYIHYLEEHNVQVDEEFAEYAVMITSQSV
jgi:hypothetical protein